MPLVSKGPSKRGQLSMIIHGLCQESHLKRQEKILLKKGSVTMAIYQQLVIYGKR